MPDKPSIWAENACKCIKNHYGISELAVIVVDSHCIPLRWGVVGISIGFYGLKPLIDYRKNNDIFGRKLTVTQGNVPDAIAAAAVGIMGESDECTPIVLVRRWPRVEFIDMPTHDDFIISPEDDIFWPLLQEFDRC